MPSILSSRTVSIRVAQLEVQCPGAWTGPHSGGRPRTGALRLCRSAFGRVLKPAREFGTPIADLVQPMPYVVYQSIIDAGFAGHGLHRYWKSACDENLSDARSDLLVRGGENLASPLSAIIIILMHGAAARVAPDATAFGARDTMGFGRRFAVVRPGGLLLSPENRSARWKLCPCSKWITPVLTSLAPVVHLGIKMGA